jgi:hypothetical protein
MFIVNSTHEPNRIVGFVKKLINVKKLPKLVVAFSCISPII